MDSKRYNRYNKLLNDLRQKFEFADSWKIIQAKLLDQLAKYEVKDLKTLRKLQKIVEPIFDKEWRKYVAKIFNVYGEVIDIVNDVYDNMDVKVDRKFAAIKAIERVIKTKLGRYESDEIRKIAKDIKKVIKKIDDRNRKYYTTHEVSEVQRKLREGLVKGENHKQITKRLKEVGGRVDQYAKTIAQTYVKGYGQVCKNEKARIAEVEWFDYIGIVRENTREFCLRLLKRKRPYHINEIKAMNNNNLGPVMIHGGGWNCHHNWEPDPLYKKED